MKYSYEFIFIVDIQDAFASWKAAELRMQVG